MLNQSANRIDPTPKKKHNPFTMVRVKKTTANNLRKLVNKINKKELGRKVCGDDVINQLLIDINEDQIKKIQESTLSNEDRLEKLYRHYCTSNGNVSKDIFIGKLISGEFNINSSIN